MGIRASYNKYKKIASYINGRHRIMMAFHIGCIIVIVLSMGVDIPTWWVFPLQLFLVSYSAYVDAFFKRTMQNEFKAYQLEC